MIVEKLYKVTLYTGTLPSEPVEQFLNDRVKKIESDGGDNRYAATIEVEEVVN